MKVSVILGHPYKNSFNHAIAETAVNALNTLGHSVMFHDLYQENFNPILTDDELVSDVSQDTLVLKHQMEIKEADGIIVIHPNWWGQPPAIIKGWVDRVLREGIAYSFSANDSGGGLPTGLLKAKIGLVFNTSNTPQSREDAVFGDPLQRIWKDCIFAFCGVTAFDRRMFRVIADSTIEDRTTWLTEVQETVIKYFIH